MSQTIELELPGSNLANPRSVNIEVLSDGRHIDFYIFGAGREEEFSGTLTFEGARRLRDALNIPLSQEEQRARNERRLAREEANSKW